MQAGIGMERSDVVVIGLGAMGSACAYQLAKRGVDVTGIDRWTPPHTFGSTHGDSRVTRQAAGEGPEYVPLVLRSQELWREIEAEAGVDLFTSCGVLMMAPQGIKAAQHGVPDRFATMVELARSFSIPHETFDDEEVVRRYPEIRLDGSYAAYFEPGGGFVRPEAAVSAQVELAQRHGARMRYAEQVLDVKHEQDGAVVVTDLGRYAAHQVVIAAGSWIDQVVPGLGLANLLGVYRQVLYWFSLDPAKAQQFAPDHFPVFVWTFGSQPADYMYGFPAIDGPSGGLKIATELYHETTTPGGVRREVSAEETRHMYDHYVAGRFPALHPEPLRTATCLYTVTPDFHFLIDRHPDHPQTLLVSPCSGHGFKHSAAIGESVAQLLTEGRSAIDLSSFTLGRRRGGPSPPKPGA